VLLCGRPFSGKSTLAAMLGARLGAAIVSLDAINLERGLHGGDGLPTEEWARTFEIGNERTVALLRVSRDVVVDDTLCFRWMRDAFRELAREAGACPVLLYLDAAEAVRRERMAINDRTKERRGIADSVLAEHLATFEPPGKDEDPIVLGAAEEIEAWLAAC